MLQVWLLGQFEIKLDGHRVVLAARAAQSLLAYLMLSAGTPHRREKLAGMFWGEFPDERARRNLRTEVWRIRKALIASTVMSPEYILTDEFTLTFNRDAEYWLDVAQFQKNDMSLEALTSALSLYRGELMPGVYDDWVSLEREHLQSLYENKMLALLEKLTEDRRWNAVIEWSERWIAQGQTPEPAYRALMVAHGAMGNLSQVALDYERCVEALRSDIGVSTSADTRALYETLTRSGTGETLVSSPMPTVFVQPSGTITFLFSDIEGSTHLLEQLGNEYAVLLAEHRDLLRQAAERYNGHEVDTQGDAFFFAFFRAVDAVNFAADAQRTLAAHSWPHDATLRVRMGLHTGEPMLARTGYVGMDVHRAARIGAAGHGGQVLLSQTTRALIENQLPEGASLVDLGEHKLKDMRYPVHIIQLSLEGLPSEFPPLKALSSGSEPPAPGDPPFKGLEFFDEQDQDLFFGREQITSNLIQALHTSEFLAVVVGASGSGKSSIVRAGVVPALKKGMPLPDGTLPPADSQNWTSYVLTPTSHPLEALATVLTRDTESVTATATLVDDLARDPRALHLWLRRHAKHTLSHAAQDQTTSDGRLQANLLSHALVVVDQFEELFTLCRDEFEREAFIDNLLTAVAYGDDGLVTILLTIRADFYAHLAQYPELRNAVSRHQEFIGPMTSQELRRAIEEPAKHKGWEFEPGLVDLILRDVGEEPGALPLLSHALLETWKRRSNHTLTLRGYHEAGGVRGAIAQTAETTYQQLTREQQAVARNVFLRLTELGEGTEDTRRRATLGELIPRDQSAASVYAVLLVLADARLITLNADSAEVAHEALIREWPQLREWLDQDRDGLRLHRQITEAAQEWELLERDTGALYRGARLFQVREWVNANPFTLNADERLFVQASEEREVQEEAEKEEQRKRELLAARSLADEQFARAQEQTRSNKRLRQRAVVLAGVLVLTLLAAGAALFFLTQSNVNLEAAEAQRAEANTQRDAAQQAQSEAVKLQRFGLARELAANAIANIEVDPERSILLALRAVATTQNTDGFVLPEAEAALHRAIQGSRVLYTLRDLTKPTQAVFSPDGSQIAAHGRGAIKVWEVKSGNLIFTIPVNSGLASEADFVSADVLTFSKDGKRLATIQTPDGKYIALDIIQLQPGNDVQEITLPISPELVTFAALDPSWSKIAVSKKDGSTSIWDLATGAMVLNLTGHSGTVKHVAYSPDGLRIATAGEDTLAKVWDAASGRELLTLSGHTGAVNQIEFSPDGQRIATASSDSTVKVWEASSGKELLSLQHPDWISGISFAPDSNLLATGSGDGNGRVWDVRDGAEKYLMAGHQAFLNRVAYSPGGTHLATTSDDGTVKVWDVGPSHELVAMPTGGISDFIFGAGTIVYSPDGSRVAVGMTDGTVKIWDAQTGNVSMVLSGHKGAVHKIAYNPDGSRLASASNDKTAKIWDTATGKEVFTLKGHEGVVMSVAWSPDGQMVATGAGDRTVKLWDSREGTLLDTLSDGKAEGYFGLAFSPDGRRLAAATALDRTVSVWDLASGNLMYAHDTGYFVFQIAFSQDSSRIAVASDDRIPKVLDTETGVPVLSLQGLSTLQNWIAYSPDGSQIATANRGGMAKVFDASSGDELQTIYASTLSVQGLAFSPDGSRLALVDDEAIRIYLLRIQDLVELAKSRVTRALTPEECVKYLHLDSCPPQ